MAPNFDNNIALISRGYGLDARQTNGFLIDLFAEFLDGHGLAYQAPMLDEAVVREIAQATLPEADIDREYVINMILERGQRIERKMGQLMRQKPSGMDTGFS